MLRTSAGEPRPKLSIEFASKSAPKEIPCMNEPAHAYTVTAITRIIKELLEESFPGIWIEGELTGYIHHSSGHHYFSLKDESAVIKCAMWRSFAASLKFTPQNGQKLLAFGDLNVYEKGGNYQLTVKKLLPAGIGPLELAFRQLHERLSREGLFGNDRKRPIPLFPRTIGIVTSPTGAAIRDIIQIARRRNRSVRLLVYPAQVQGNGAETTVVAGIEYFNRRDDVDLLIVGRGGGSLEDLWPFNTEVLVRAVIDSRIPVISGVGHEIDTTLCDLAADLRAPTPSAAAEIAVWSRDDFRAQIGGELRAQSRALQEIAVSARRAYRALLTRPIWQEPRRTIWERQQYLDQLLRLLTSSGKIGLERSKNRLSLLMSQLDALSPLRVLMRGYSVTTTETGRVVRSVSEAPVGVRILTRLSDGTLQSQVTTADRLPS